MQENIQKDVLFHYFNNSNNQMTKRVSNGEDKFEIIKILHTLKGKARTKAHKEITQILENVM